MSDTTAKPRSDASEEQTPEAKSDSDTKSEQAEKKKEYVRPLDGLGGEKPDAPAWFNWALDYPCEEGAVDVNGASIKYTAWGDPNQRGMLFIHGGRAHRNWWRPFAPFFAEQFRVAAFDLSGMGDSDWRTRYSMDCLVDEVFAVIEAAKLNLRGLPIVVGHSFGGYVTLAAVEREGERFSGAVVIDSPIAKPDPAEGYTVSRAGDKKKKEQDEKQTRKQSKRVYDAMHEPIERFRLLPNQPCTELYLLDYIARQGLIKAPKEDGGVGWTWKFDPHQGDNFDIHFDRDLFTAPRCPLGFIYGEESAFVKLDGFEHLKERVAGRSPFIMMPAAHHHLMLDQPIAFISTLRTLVSCWPIKVGL